MSQKFVRWIFLISGIFTVTLECEYKIVTIESKACTANSIIRPMYGFHLGLNSECTVTLNGCVEHQDYTISLVHNFLFREGVPVEADTHNCDVFCSLPMGFLCFDEYPYLFSFKGTDFEPVGNYEFRLQAVHEVGMSCIESDFRVEKIHNETIDVSE